jgi:IS5 family transposase
MREKHQKQMPLVNTPAAHPQTQEMKAISDIIDAKPNICEYVLQDLIRDKNPAVATGANGMTAEQVLRAAIVYRLHDCTYGSLAFYLEDSKLLRPNKLTSQLGSRHRSLSRIITPSRPAAKSQPIYT